MELVVIGRGLSGWDDACGQPGFVFNVDRGGGFERHFQSPYLTSARDTTTGERKVLKVRDFRRAASSHSPPRYFFM